MELAALIARDPQAWKSFLEEYGGQIEQACRRALRTSGRRPDEAALADACAEVIRILLDDDCRLLRQHRPGARLGAYLNVIAFSRTLNGLRQRKALPWLPERFAQAADEPLRMLERSQRLQEAMNALPPRDAELLRLFHLEDLGYAEIALRTGEPADQVGTLLARARQKLRKALGDDFLESV